MDERTLPTQETPRQGVRKELSERVIHFAPSLVAGQQRFVFDEEPKQEEAQDEQNSPHNRCSTDPGNPIQPSLRPSGGSRQKADSCPQT